MISQQSTISKKQAKLAPNIDEWAAVETSTHFDDFFTNQIAATDWGRLVKLLNNKAKQLQAHQKSIGCNPILDI